MSERQWTLLWAKEEAAKTPLALQADVRMTVDRLVACFDRRTPIGDREFLEALEAEIARLLHANAYAHDFK